MPLELSERIPWHPRGTGRFPVLARRYLGSSETITARPSSNQAGIAPTMNFTRPRRSCSFDVRKFMRDDDGIDAKRCKTKPDARIADSLCAAATEPSPTDICGAGENLWCRSQLAIEIGDLCFALAHSACELRLQRPRHGGIGKGRPESCSKPKQRGQTSAVKVGCIERTMLVPAMRKPIRPIATILYQRFTLSRFINYPLTPRPTSRSFLAFEQNAGPIQLRI